MEPIEKEGYFILKKLDKQLEWIARDSDGTLGVYGERPKKYMDYWTGAGVRSQIPEKYNDLFKHISWEDSTPCNIQYLINEYESSYYFSLDTSLELDESQFNIHINGGITLPRFIADFVEEHKGEYFTDIFNSAELWQWNEKVAKWLYGDEMLTSQREIILALALNFGYTIEEPLFYVEFIKEVYLVYYPASGNLGVTNDRDTRNGITEFTKEQIKGFDKGDVMFEHYAHLIEEGD